MLFASPLKASHQHKNLSSSAEAQLCRLSRIPKTKTLPAEWTHNSEDSFYLSIPHWVVTYRDALRDFYHLNSSEMCWDMEWRLWIEKTPFSVVNCIFCKSVVYHRGYSTWKEQKMGCSSTPSLCWPVDTSCLAGIASDLHYYSGTAWGQSLCLPWPSKGRKFGALAFEAHSHLSLHQCRCREVAVPLYSLYCCHLRSELKREQSCNILLIELCFCFTTTSLKILVF